MGKPLIGILGGSGLYQMDGLTEVQEHVIGTPFGQPSDAVVTGKIAGTEVAFLARHGRGHHLIPTEVPYRANIYSLKSLGVRYLISVSAVGSLREEMHPLDMVLPDQFIDLTKHRTSTFFGNGAVAHVLMAQPVCPALSALLAQAIEEQDFIDLKLHTKGTYSTTSGCARLANSQAADLVHSTETALPLICTMLFDGVNIKALGFHNTCGAIASTIVPIKSESLSGAITAASPLWPVISSCI